MKKKNLLFRFAVLVAAMMCALGASAYSFVYNNFYYNITGTNPATVEVTYKDTNYNSYSGNVTIPSSVTYNGVTYTVTAIGAGAFQNCENLTGVAIPNTVKTIGVAAFNNCYHYDFTTLVLPPSVITIESSAFDNCTGLTQLTLPASLKSIGSEAFKNCDKLKHVTIPASVTSIGSDAFGYCSNLLGVTCLAATPPTLSGNYTFYSSVYSGGTLFVPKGSVDAYKSANYWSRFTNVQPHLEYALNEKGSNITFSSTGDSSTGDYPWTNIVEGSRVYASSGNMGAHNSSSEMTATVTLSAPDSIKFDFKALGEGSNYDVCVFMVDGTQKFSYGSRQDTWETYSAYLSTGTHTLTWRYTKDGSFNPTGDYFAVDNVRLVTEAYACYTPSNTTLTFYYDAKRSSRSGTTYDLNTGDDYPGWYSDNTKNNVTKVVFDPSFADAKPTTTCAWFRDMTRLQTITGLYYLNTSQVTSMKGMFAWCDNLQSVDVSNFNTANVTDMIAMFACCEQLSSLNLSHFSTSNVTQMSNMFVGCHQLTSLDVSSFNTDKVTNMYAMFGDCPKLTSLDLSGFKTTKLTDMSLMFHDCSQLQTIYVGDGWSTTDVTNSSNMFKNCTSLVGGMGTTYDASHIDKAYAHIDGGPSNPGYFTAKTEAYACYTPSNTTLTFYYDTRRSSRTGTTYDLNTNYDTPGWITDDTYASVTKVVFDPSFADARPLSTVAWFKNMENLHFIEGVKYLNTSEVYLMPQMFYGCSSITSLDLSSFNTSKVSVMNHMFNRCANLRTIYVGDGWSTSAVNQSSNMFYGCTSLVGGMGTTYSSSNPTNKTYAHIDGGPSNPGYFTDKNATLRGDVNGRDGVTIADVSALIDYLLTGDTTGINMAAADCNGLDGVTIADVSALIDYLLTGSW